MPTLFDGLMGEEGNDRKVARPPDACSQGLGKAQRVGTPTGRWRDGALVAKELQWECSLGGGGGPV